MIRLTIAATALAGLALSGCSMWNSGGAPNAASNGQHSVAMENANARDQNANSSVQAGGAGPSPNGGNSNPGTSGTISPRPAAQTAGPH
ncbi:MAG TPA: hypothetical protein VGC92_00140 [Phenylobacterium sp.]|jgi:hypothetical protein